MLYLIEYSSSRWCGAPYNCVVEASSEDEAEDIATEFMDSHMREEFADEDEDEDEDDDGFDPAFSVNSVEVLDETNVSWKYYQDPVQRINFYPQVN